MKTIRISTQGTPHDYRVSLLPLIVGHLGYKIEWSKPTRADLQILGPFLNPMHKQFSWCPKPLRPLAVSIQKNINLNKINPPTSAVTLFHTQENVRHDFIKSDFAISFDLAVNSPTHFRLPYWMEMIDWSHEGLKGNLNLRYGQLLSLKKLKSPLGDRYLKRKRAGALLSSHLREPRASIFHEINKLIPVEGIGANFNKNIKDHHSSGFLKRDVLNEFAFNICPENGLYPGYYTEKIPEAFDAGCLPISWTDENVGVDFNPKAFINLLPFFKNDLRGVKDALFNSAALEQYQSEALILNSPSLDTFKEFLRELLRTSTS